MVHLLHEPVFQNGQFAFMAGLFLAGMLASFVNMLAGGGSLLTLGFMMLSGVEPAVANASNRIGVLMACSSGAAAYRSENYSDIKESFRLSLWALPGAILGAFFSIGISNALFEKLMVLVMIFVLLTLFLPKKKDDAHAGVDHPVWLAMAMILAGFYGGFIQVGVGFLIAAGLRHLGNMSLMRMNMHRIFIVLIFTIPVVGVFMFSHKINWLYAVILSTGNALGSWLTVKLALKQGEKLVKIGMAAAIVLMSIKFLFF